MAITTLNGLIAGVTAPVEVFKAGGAAGEAAGLWHSMAYTSGLPGAAAVPTPGLAGEALTTYAGQLPFTNPSAGQSTYVTRCALATSQFGMVRLYDRLWHNSGLVPTTTTAQTVNSVTWPARDRAGTTAGVGVGVGIEVSTATTNASSIANMTMSYTNSAGVAGRAATIFNYPGTAVAGTFVPFQLQAGDVGVRSIQSVTLGTSLVSGAVHLVAYRSILNLSMPNANVGVEVNAVTGGMPQLYDNSVLFLHWLLSGTTVPNLNGTVTYAQG